MNIWYLSAYDQPKGQSSRTYDFSKELVNRGHHVTMFTNSYCHFTHIERLSRHEKWRIEEIDGIRVVWLRTIPYIGNGWRRAANMLLNALRAIQVSQLLADKPNIVIGPSVPLFTGWAALRIAKKKDAAFIFEVRDIWPQALVDLGVLKKNSLAYKLFRVLEKKLYHQAQRISAVLPFTWTHVSKSGVDSKKVHWIPNGVNLERFENLPTYKGGHSPLTAMYVGGFAITHDVSTIIKAAKILEEKGTTGYRFIIVGNGLRRAECENEANDLKLQNVEFCDSVPKNEVPRLQMRADVLIASVKNTPVYQFGINSNKLYDYLASARPIIFAGNVPNNFVVESGAGFGIPPENPMAMVEALEKILKMTPIERIKMGERGRRWIEKEFNMLMLGERMEDLLEQAVHQKKVQREKY